MNISHLCTWPLPSKTVNTGKLSPLPPTRMWIDPPASNSHKWRSIGINNPGAACYLLLVGYIDPNTPKSSKKLEEQDSHLTGKCCDVTKKTSRFGGYDISHKKNTWEIRKIRFTKCSTTGVRISNIYIYELQSLTGKHMWMMLPHSDWLQWAFGSIYNFHGPPLFCVCNNKNAYE